jgi:hypothetical protein
MGMQSLVGAGAAILAVGLLAGPVTAHASLVCQEQNKVVREMCFHSFVKALGRKGNVYKTPKQKSENEYAASVCMASGQLAERKCEAGDTPKDGDCDWLATTVRDNMDYICTVSDRPDKILKLDKTFPLLSAGDRKNICFSGWEYSSSVTRKLCHKIEQMED